MELRSATTPQRKAASAGGACAGRRPAGFLAPELHGAGSNQGSGTAGQTAIPAPSLSTWPGKQRAAHRSCMNSTVVQMLGQIRNFKSWSTKTLEKSLLILI